jgi:hypothetical protein
MATLSDIAKKIGDLTVAYAPINKNPQAPKRGNLKKQLAKRNTPQFVKGTDSAKNFNVKNRTTFGLEFTIDYAPPGAEYGKFVEEGFKHKGGKQIPPNPFAERAINDRQVDDMIMQYLEELSVKIGQQIEDVIDKELK